MRPALSSPLARVVISAPRARINPRCDRARLPVDWGPCFFCGVAADKRESHCPMPVILDADLFQKVLSIIIIDLVLSGDNAVVIALASRRLPPRQRRISILLGGAAAVGLRILFTALATVLLGI